MQKTATDVALSSRIRLARNISGIPFAGRMNKQDIEKAIDMVKQSLSIIENGSDGQYNFLPLANIPPLERHALMEEHMVSPEFIQGDEKKALLLSGEISIMLMEEDHIRIQAIAPGYDLEDAFALANGADQQIGKSVKYAHSDRYGYLTKCPTNTGTGMRASVMLHLPALTLTQSIAKVIAALGKLGIAIRGFYGEGSETLGDFYQVSNQITLGIDAQESIKKLSEVVDMVIVQERQTRETLKTNNAAAFYDRIGRSYGTMKYACSMSSNEFLKLASDVRMGIATGVITEITLNDIDSLITQTMPAHILRQLHNQENIPARDILRADTIRKKLHSSFGCREENA